ncbi:unnamed protein product, partial [Darwinula stevensoni]
METIIKDGIRMPNDLAIDQAAQKLYWVDARLDKIEECDLDGKKRRILLQDHPQHPFQVAVHGKFLFWTDWVLNDVVRFDMITEELHHMEQNVAKPMSII